MEVLRGPQRLGARIIAPVILPRSADTVAIATACSKSVTKTVNFEVNHVKKFMYIHR